MAAVALENICKSYDGTKVVHSLNLDIPDKEFTVFVGPSGCGKSTTLRMIAGLETITDGSILIGERVVNDMPPRMRNIAMVFQDYALYPHMTVAKNLGFGLKITGLPQAEIKQRVGQAAETLGITELLDRKPGQLSGGQRQRVAMGRAIVREPDVYLFDEPLSNLDAKLRAQMRVEVKKLHQRVGNTIIYVTHDQVEAMTLADRIVIMRDGIIEQVGKPRDIFENPANTFVATFIGSPPMNLVEAQLDTAAGELRLADGHSLPLPGRMRAVKELPQQLTVGIRPADMTPVGHGLAHDSLVAKITLEVELGEDLGTETIVLSSLGGQPINAVMYNPVPLTTGKPMTFEIAVDKLHLFDRATGLNVLTQ